MVPILQAQLAAYGNRGVGLVPSQAGAGSSAIGGTISIYAVGANLIWAFLGYHADGADGPDRRAVAAADAARVRDARPRPVAVRACCCSASSPCRWRRCSRSVRCAATCSSCATSPAPCRRCCCSPRGSSRRRRVRTGGRRRRRRASLTAVMVVGLVDQQLNGANPRLYDFKGAFDRHRGRRRGGRHRAVRAGLPRRGRRRTTGRA